MEKNDGMEALLRRDGPGSRVAGVIDVITSVASISLALSCSTFQQSLDLV